MKEGSAVSKSKNYTVMETQKGGVKFRWVADFKNENFVLDS